MERSEGRFEGAGGIRLFAQSWLPNRSPAAILAIVHGFGEHSGRYGNVVTEMLARNIGVVGFDLRGHGRSPGQRGHINSWGEYHDDLQAFLNWVIEQDYSASTFLLGHSLGSLIVTEFMMSEPEDLSGIVLSSLGVDPVGIAKPLIVAIARLLSRPWPTFPVKLGLDPRLLSRDRQVVQAFNADPLVHGMTSMRWGTETLAVIERIKASARRINVPLLLLHGTGDRINSLAGAQAFFRKASPDKGEFRSYVDSYHEPHNDWDHQKVVGDIASWIHKQLPRRSSAPDRRPRLITLARRFDLERYPSGWSTESETTSATAAPSGGSAPKAFEADQTTAFQQVNRARFRPEANVGHYESYFQRANHPERPLAFWIRYTIFCPKTRPDSAVGQLWAIFFNGEANRISAVKEEFPIQDCRFSGHGLSVRIGPAYLENHALQGLASQNGESIEWDLTYDGKQAPLFLMPRENYDRKLPAAKALVGLPFAKYRGTIRVNQDEVVIDDWVGSQNHNWGRRHTDQYAWGQVAGFDNQEDAFIECATARLKLGPLWTPRLTNVVLRLGDHDYALNSIRQGLRARGRYDYFTWTFHTATPQVRISGKIEADRNQFVGLIYGNPPGGTKHCLNTKIASCRVMVERPGQKSLELFTRSRAAFEIVTDDRNHGVPMIT